MKTNPLVEGVREGRVQIGTWINLARDPGILQLLKAVGFDYARFDMEHSPYSMETLADFALVARGFDIPLVVRPPTNDVDMLMRLLDAGVWCLHLPGVETPEIAEQIARAVRYAPDGLRGAGGIGPSVDYEEVGPKERAAHQNAQVFVTVMLETRGAFEALDEIASIKGIDALTLGPQDLSQDLGVLGQPEQESVLREHRLRLIDACKRHGKAVAMMANTPEQVKWVVEQGVKLIAYRSDVAVLAEAYREQLAVLRQGLPG